MRRLEEIKEDLAIEYGWKDYAELFLGGATTDEFLNEVAKQYARECCIATQKACRARVVNDLLTPQGALAPIGISKDAIDNPDNIILL